MQRVFVLDKNKQPLAPCHPARARQLLKNRRAAVYRQQPFTIIIKDREGGDTQETELKIDPGSRTTGLALVQHNQRGKRVIWAAHLYHRGLAVRDALLKRRQLRRARRSRKTRYRQPRFLNRRKPIGWLPPSLESRVQNILTWVNRLNSSAPITALAVELARFDTQRLQNPEISGVEYQQGELYGYEVREYLLEKWGRHCAYCGVSRVPLQVEHIIPKDRGGSNRVSNLTIACQPCNQEKGNRTAEEYGFPEIQVQAKRPLRDVAAVNATRWALWQRLAALGLPLVAGTGGQTKYNRCQQGYPKAHWIDAACVGRSGKDVQIVPSMRAIQIRAVGRGKRQKCGTDRYGFPIRHAGREKRYLGFQTGDIVMAIVPKGKAAGKHIGRVTIRRRPRFRLNGYDIHPKYMLRLQRADGFEYEFERRLC